MLAQADATGRAASGRSPPRRAPTISRTDPSTAPKPSRVLSAESYMLRGDLPELGVVTGF